MVWQYLSTAFWCVFIGCRDITHLSWHYCELRCIKMMRIFPKNSLTYTHTHTQSALNKSAHFCACITVSVIVFTYNVWVCPHLCHYFIVPTHVLPIVWKHLQHRIHFITIEAFWVTIRHKSINMKALERGTPMLQCFFVLNCIKMSLSQLFSFSIYLFQLVSLAE